MAFKNIFQPGVARLLYKSKGANDNRRAPGTGVAKVEGQLNLNTENLQKGLGIAFRRWRFIFQPVRRA